MDELFRHAWHYFDRIILPDQALDSIFGFEEHRDVERLRRELVGLVNILAYIDSIGGSSLVAFEPRESACTVHMAEHAMEAGLSDLTSDLDGHSARVARHSRISFVEEKHGDHTHLDVALENYSLFEHVKYATFCTKSTRLPSTEKELRLHFATHTVTRYFANLCADVKAARARKAPLGTTIKYYRALMRKPGAPTDGDVAFTLSLPFAKRIPIEVLLRLRNDEADTFERFRGSIRAAVNERLLASGSSRAHALAAEIRRDVLEPEIRRIRTTLSAAERYSKLTAGSGVFLGVLIATVGLLTPVAALGPGLVAGGAVAVGAASVKKAFDELMATRREVELSDMYFLWNAHKHSTNKGWR